MFRLLYSLLSAQTGSGKTTMAAHLAMLGKFSYVKVSDTCKINVQAGAIHRGGGGGGPKGCGSTRCQIWAWPYT